MTSVVLESKHIIDQEQRWPTDPITDLHVVHLTSSRFFGGPERQMLELAKELAGEVKTTFVSFSESGLCEAFLENVRELGFSAHALVNDTPHLIAAKRELKQYLGKIGADILCCHGYKANLLGLWVVRKIGIPVVSVSRGWTAECWKVRLYEWLDRRILCRMDQVVCVSEGQAEKVRGAGVPDRKVMVIQNAIRTERFQAQQAPQYRHKLESLFPVPPKHIIGAAGRLSPEKGFDILIDACQQLIGDDKLDLGVVLFGDGFLRDQLQDQIDAASLTEHFILAGFTHELDCLMPYLDIFVQSSHTEGLPNVLLEAGAAGVPVVATNVGGTPEVVEDGKNGYLVSSANATELAQAILRLVADDNLRRGMGLVENSRVREEFSFAKQAREYQKLFDELTCAVHPKEQSACCESFGG